jgi:hypothetical protein
VPEVKEVIAELKTDYGTQDGSIPYEVSVDEPVVDQEKDTGESELKETAGSTEKTTVKGEAKPTIDPEVEKLRKANAELGYNLREREREHDRRLKFLEKELQEANARKLKEDEIKTFNEKLKSLEQLKEDDPVEYLNKRDQLNQERFDKRLEEASKITQVNKEIDVDLDRQQEINAKLTRDFPDMTDTSSPLFQETLKYMYGRYSKEKVDSIIRTDPERVYDMVTIVDKDLKIRKVSEKGADKDRLARVNGQGAVQTVPGKDGSDGSVGLNAEQERWAKSRGWSKEQRAKYAEFIKGAK